MTTHKLSASIAAMATLWLLPAAALAQDAGTSASMPASMSASKSDSSGEVTIGGAYTGGTNTGQAGRYDGMTEKGFDLYTSFTYQRRDQPASGGTSYTTVDGQNLNLQTGSQTSRGYGDPNFRNGIANSFAPEGSVEITAGNQGSWKVKGDYDAITYTGNAISSLYTLDPNSNSLSLNPGLTPYGGASNSPLTKGTIFSSSYNAATLPSSFQQVQTGTRRDIISILGEAIFGSWTLGTEVRHDYKHGSLEESMRATWGGMAFQLPVDTDTDRFDIKASYQSRDLQALVQYTYSRFTQNDPWVALPYPVSQTALTASSGPYAQSAAYSNMPSNSAHYLTGMAGYNLAPRTRLVSNLRLGYELQNDLFAPNSADPNLSSTLGNPAYSWFKNLNASNQGTSFASGDFSAFVYQGNLSVNSELLDGLDSKITYGFDGRDVTQNVRQVWIGGTSPDAQANTAVFSVPQNWLNQTAKAELTYKLWPEYGTKLIAEYTYKNTHRTNAQVENSRTSTGSLQLNTMVGTDAIARLSYEHAERSGSLIYGEAWGYLETGAADLLGTPSGAYYQAPMTSDSVTLRYDYAPKGEFSAGIYARYRNESFTYPANLAPLGDANYTITGTGQGIKRDYVIAFGPDVNWRPADSLNLHVYYTYEKTFWDNRGNGACAASTAGACLGSAGYFQNTEATVTHSAGVDGEWQASEDIKLKAAYNYASGVVNFGEFNGVVVPVVTAINQNETAYPNINTTMNNLRLVGTYAISQACDWSLIYNWDTYKANDWADVAQPVIATTNAGTAIGIVNAGYGPRSYNRSTIGTVLSYKF